MAALSITAANVTLSSGTVLQGPTLVLGGVVTAGQPAYAQNATTYNKAANTNSTIANCAGVFLLGGSTGQSAVIAKNGSTLSLGTGTGCTTAQTYILGDTAGNINEIGDLGTGDYLTILGYGGNGTTLILDITATGLAKA